MPKKMPTLRRLIMGIASIMDRQFHGIRMFALWELKLYETV